MLVSGVRSSCEASATKSRWRSSAASLSPRAAESSRSMSSSVWARSETSSLACGLGSVTSGSRVLATSRAARVSPAIGRIARRATNSPPAKASNVPPPTPKARKTRTLFTVRSTLPSGLAYWTYATGSNTGRGSGLKEPSELSAGATSWRETTRRSPEWARPSPGPTSGDAPGG